MGSLVVCASCSRHIRRTETSCPFCRGTIESAVANAPERPLPATRLGRAALLAFAAASVGAAGCGGTVDGTSREGIPEGGATSTGGAASTGGTKNVGGFLNIAGNVGSGGDFITPPYGAPFPEDAGLRTVRLTDASTSDARIPPGHRQALYGAPPPPPQGHDGGFAFYVRPKDDELTVVDEDGKDDPVG